MTIVVSCAVGWQHSSSSFVDGSTFSDVVAAYDAFAVETFDVAVVHSIGSDGCSCVADSYAFAAAG